MPVSNSISPAITVVDRGEATGGSLTSLVDSKKDWPVDLFRGSAVNFLMGGVVVTRRISSNTATVINFESIGAAVAAGTRYFIVGSITITSGSDINIASQAADIDVRLAASTITMDVNVTNATIAITGSVSITGVAQIDIESQSVGVYLQPEWASKTGLDKVFYFTADCSPDFYNYHRYTVPAGKTLYVVHFTTSSYALNTVDRDKPQTLVARVQNRTDSLVFASVGADSGISVTFSQPLVIPEGKEVEFAIFNRGAHDCRLSTCASCYEI